MADTKATLINLICEKINEIARDTPFRAAVHDGDSTIDYGTLRTIIHGVMEKVSHAGLIDSDRIGIYMDNTAEAYGAILASAFSGLTYVPLPTDEPQPRLRYFLQNAEPRIVLTTPSRHDEIRKACRDFPPDQCPEIVLVNSRDLVSRRPNDNEELSVRWSNAPLYMLYTSGSTGKPKGVPVSADCVENFIFWARGYFAINEDDIFLAYSRITFDLSVFNIFLPFLAGGAVCPVSDTLAQIYPGELLAKGVTIALMVPRVTNRMLEAGQLEKNSYPSLRHLLFCGEKLFANQVNPWTSSHTSLAVHNLYGPTETTVACTCHSFHPGVHALDPVPIGTPLPNIVLAIDGKTTEPAEGELFIAGRQTTPFDYWRSQSHRFFVDSRLGRCFKSGDMVRREKGGLLFWLGRTDDQLKISGRRVEPGEIEEVYSQHSGVRELLCVFDKDREELCLIVSLKNPQDKDRILDELESLGTTYLPAFMRAHRIEIVAAIPRNANGKADRTKAAQLLSIGVTANPL